MVTKSYQWLLLAILALLPAYLVRFSVFGIPTTVLELAIYLAVIITLWLITQKQLELVVPDVRWIHPIALFVLRATKLSIR
ncbi:hypothetical protein HY065_02115 [Candidatus Berkelbacteria bacterium]|nr:hypothetical protein [Candidatus Berkelbacteria bacterium]